MNPIWWIVILALAAFAILLVLQFKDRLPYNNPVRKFVRLIANVGKSQQPQLLHQQQQQLSSADSAFDAQSFVEQLADVFDARISSQAQLATQLAVQSEQAKLNKLIERPGVSVGDSDITPEVNADGTESKHRPPKSHSRHDMYVHDYSNVGFKRRTRMLRIHANQTNYDVSTGKLTVPVNQKNVESFELLNWSIPKGQFVISEDNKTFAITHDTPSYDGTVTIVEGIYTALTLESALQTAINDALTGSPVTVTYNPLSESYTIASTGTISLDFANYGVIGAMLGFVPTGTYALASSHTSPNRIDLTRGRFLEIKGTGMNAYYGNTDVVGNIDFTSDINTSRDLTAPRTFVQPVAMNNVVLDLRVQEADGSYSTYNNRGFQFHLTFSVRVVVDCINTDSLPLTT